MEKQYSLSEASRLQQQITGAKNVQTYVYWFSGIAICSVLIGLVIAICVATSVVPSDAVSVFSAVTGYIVYAAKYLVRR